MAYNLPPGCTLNDIDPPVCCDNCRRPLTTHEEETLDPDSEMVLCATCRLTEDDDE